MTTTAAATQTVQQFRESINFDPRYNIEDLWDDCPVDAEYYPYY